MVSAKDGEGEAGAVAQPVGGRGPVFICYPRIGGSEPATAVHRLLTAAGVTPWRDIRDMGAGPWDANIGDVLARSSGGIIILPPSAAHSRVITTQEAPELLRRAFEDGLALVIVTTAFEDGKPDHETIRSWLGTSDERWDKIATMPLTQVGMLTAVSRVAFDSRQMRTAGPLPVRFLTRGQQAGEGEGIPYDVSLASISASDLVHPESVHALACVAAPTFSATSPNRDFWTQVSHAAGDRAEVPIRLTVRAHPSICLVAGFLFPPTRFDQVDIVDHGTWLSLPSPARVAETTQAVSVPEKFVDVVVERGPETPHSGQHRALVFVEFTGTTDGDAFHRQGGVMESEMHLRPQGDAVTTPESFADRVISLDALITRHVDRYRVDELHLLFAGPAFLAVGLGRALTRASGPDIVVYDYVKPAQAKNAFGSESASGYVPVCRLSYNSGLITEAYDWRINYPVLGSERLPVPVSGFPLGVSDSEPESAHIVNLTPHDVTVVRPDGSTVVIEKSSDRGAIRLEEISVAEWHMGFQGQKIPMKTMDYLSEMDTLPPQLDNTIYLVSRPVAARFPGRRDLFFPTEELRGESGAIVGCRRLGRFSGL